MQLSSVWCTSQALQEMRKLRTEKTGEVKEVRLRLEHLKTHKDHSTKLKSEIADGQEKDRNYMTQINELEQQSRVGLDTHFILLLHYLFKPVNSFDRQLCKRHVYALLSVASVFQKRLHESILCMLGTTGKSEDETSG